LKLFGLERNAVGYREKGFKDDVARSAIYVCRGTFLKKKPFSGKFQNFFVF